VSDESKHEETKAMVSNSAGVSNNSEQKEHEEIFGSTKPNTKG
jgi:hypothetical protein